MFESGQGMSIFATLMAEDKMSNVFKRAAGASQTLGQKLKNTVGMGAAMQVGMSAVSSAMHLVTSSFDGAISRYDSLQRFPKQLENLGIGAEAASRASKKLSKGIEGLPTTLDSATSGVTRLVAKNGDINKSTKYYLAMNDAIVAGGASMDIQSSAAEQLAQAYSKGKPDMMEWRSMMTAMPGQLTQVAKSMGMTADELGEGLRNGSISMDDFMDKLVELDTKGANGFKSFHDQAQSSVGGIATNISLFKTAIVRGIADAIDNVNKALERSNLPTIGGMIAIATEKVNKAFKAVSDIISRIDFKGAASSMKSYYDTAAPILHGIGKAIKRVSIFLAEHAGALAAVIPAIWLTVKGFRAMAFISTIAPGIKTVSKALISLAKNKMLSLLPGKLAGTAGGIGGTGTAGAAAAPSLIELGAAILMVGAGVLLAGAGLAILAMAAIKLAEAGWPAIAVMAGLVAVMAALAYGASLIAAPLAAAGTGFLILGAGILLAGAGIGLVVASVALLASQLPKMAMFAGVAATGMVKLASALIVVGAAGFVVLPGMIMAAAGFGAAALAALALFAALVPVKSSLKTIAKSAKSAAASIRSIQSGTSVAANAMTALKSSTSNTVSSIKSGMSSAKTSVSSAMNSIKGSLKSGSSSARSNGANISKGFARGIRSSLGEVRSAVNEMVKLADKATRAKAKIKSPSRLFAELGAYVSEGFALGIESNYRMIMAAANNMVSIPAVNSASDGMILNDAYSYGQGSRDIEIPLYINGKEFARATASEVNSEIERIQGHNNRKHGRV